MRNCERQRNGKRKGEKKYIEGRRKGDNIELERIHEERRRREKRCEKGEGEIDREGAVRCEKKRMGGGGWIKKREIGR